MYLYLLKYCYKKPCTHEYITSTTEYFLNFNQIGEKNLIVSQARLHLFQMPLICLFQTWKKWPLFFRCQNQKIVIFMIKMNKKCAPLCFDQIKNKKVASSVFFFEK